MANLQKQRLIKQCQVTLGEDFWTDFIFEDVNFFKPSEIKEAYEKWQVNYKDEYEIIQEEEGSSIDGRTKEFREKLKDLLYKKEFAITEKQLAGLKKKSEKSGIAYGILKKVFDRGMAAWKTGHRPGATPHQWAYARVNSFITGGKTRTTADADLWAKHKGKKEDLENSLYGEELQEAKKVIAQVELWNGKKMKKSFKNQSAAEKFIKKMQDQEDVRGYNMYAEEDLQEAMKFWTVTITKKAGKLFKGQTVDVKARNSAEAIKKGLKQMKANPNTVPSDSVDAVLGENIQEAKEKQAAFDGKDSDYKKLIKDLKKARIKVKDEDEMDGFKILTLDGSDYAIDKILNKYPDLQVDEDKHSGPCWDTHKMVGMKKKKGYPGMVPNCVPRK